VLPARWSSGSGWPPAVAPLTATVLASADERTPGWPAGSTTRCRAAGLLASPRSRRWRADGEAYTDPARFLHGFRSRWWSAAALMAGGGTGLLDVQDDALRGTSKEQEPQCKMHCAAAGRH